MCVSARFEGLLQRVCVRVSPPTYRAFAKILAKYSARVARQNTRLGWL